MNAAQALEFRRPLRSSPFLESFVKAYRTEVKFVEEDTVLHDEIIKTADFINSLTIDSEELFG